MGILLLFALLALLAQAVPGLRLAFHHDQLIGPVMLLLTIAYAAAFFGRAFPWQPAGVRWGKAALFGLAFVLALMVPYRFLLVSGLLPDGGLSGRVGLGWEQ